MIADRYKYFVLMILTCCVFMAGVCATCLAEDNNKQPGKVAAKDAAAHEKSMTRVFKQLQAKDPALAKKLTDIRKTDPGKFHEELFAAVEKYKLEIDIKPDSGAPKDNGGQAVRQEQHREKMKQWEKERNAEYIAWLKENYPEEADKLEKLQDKPGTFNRQIRESKKTYGEIMEMQKENPKIAEIMKELLEVENTKRMLIEKVQTLGRKIKNAKGPQRDKLVQELKDVLSVRFDFIIKKQKLQYAVLEEKIRQLNEQIAEQKAETEKLAGKKDEEIAKRMKNILAQDKSTK